MNVATQAAEDREVMHIDEADVSGIRRSRATRGADILDALTGGIASCVSYLTAALQRPQRIVPPAPVPAPPAQVQS